MIYYTMEQYILSLSIKEIDLLMSQLKQAIQVLKNDPYIQEGLCKIATQLPRTMGLQLSNYLREYAKINCYYGYWWPLNMTQVRIEWCQKQLKLINTLAQ